MKVICLCWTCKKEHDMSQYSPTDHSIKCECGGYIITPSGKTYSKLIPETMEEKIMLGLVERAQ